MSRDQFARGSPLLAAPQHSLPHSYKVLFSLFPGSQIPGAGAVCTVISEKRGRDGMRGAPVPTQWAADPAQTRILATSPPLCSSSMLPPGFKSRRTVKRTALLVIVHSVHAAASKAAGLATCIRVRGFTHPERGARPRSGRASKGLVRASQQRRRCANAGSRSLFL